MLVSILWICMYTTFQTQGGRNRVRLYLEMNISLIYYTLGSDHGLCTANQLPFWLFACGNRTDSFGVWFWPPNDSALGSIGRYVRPWWLFFSDWWVYLHELNRGVYLFLCRYPDSKLRTPEILLKVQRKPTFLCLREWWTSYEEDGVSEVWGTFPEVEWGFRWLVRIFSSGYIVSTQHFLLIQYFNLIFRAKAMCIWKTQGSPRSASCNFLYNKWDAPLFPNRSVLAKIIFPSESRKFCRIQLDWSRRRWTEEQVQIRNHNHPVPSPHCRSQSKLCP